MTQTGEPPMPLDTLIAMASNLEPVRGHRLAAAIVYKRRVIAYGWNMRKSHPFQARFGKTADAIYWHAETMAICNVVNAGREQDLRRSTLVVIRLMSSGALGLAKPCSGCQSAIDEYGVRDVYYS